jgi:hypothetical protein
MLTLDDDEVDLALMMIKWARAEADINGEPKAFGPCLPICRWALTRVDTLIERIEQHQKDVAEEKADGAA